MRSGVTAAGAFMIIVGVAMMFILPGIMAEEAGTGGLLWGLSFSVVVGSVIGFLGFVILIAGLAASPPKEQPTQVKARPDEKEKPKTEVLAICPECKTRIPSSTKFCPECGADLRKKRG